MGDITPCIGGYWTPTGGDGGAFVGADLKRQVGARPFSLIGNVELRYAFGGAGALNASLRIRFSQGEVNTAKWWN